MKRLAAALSLLLAGAFLLADDGHDHGEAAASSPSAAIDVELKLQIVDPQGQVVKASERPVRFALQEEGHSVANLDAERNDESGVHHVEQTFAHEGSYIALWDVPADGRELTAKFDLVVGHEGGAESGASPIWLWVIGGAAGLVLAFFVGRSTAKGRAAVTGCLGLMLAVGSIPVARADEGHDHGPAAPAGEGPYQIGIGRVGLMSSTLEVDGYRLTMTIAVLPPDPSLVRLDAEQRELLGLQVETIGRAEFGKGISATGEIEADPSRVANVSVMTAGRVESISASLGQVVRRGQVLAVVNVPEAAAALADVAAAQAGLLQAQANRQRASQSVELARQNLNRQEKFAREGAFSQPSLQAARNEQAAADSDLAAAQSALRQAQVEQATHARELERVRQLYADKLASRRELEMAELEASLDAERVEGARQHVVQAQERARIARETVLREERIQEQGLYNQREIENARADLTRAQGDLRAAETEVRGAQSMVSAARSRAGAYGGRGGRIALTAPINGVVVKRNVNQGEAVEAGRALVEILDTSEVWVKVDLFETDISKVRRGMSVEVKADSDPDRVLQGRVELIGTVVESDKRTASVRIRVQNPDGALRQNEFVKALIITDVEGRQLSVPASAIQEVSGLKVVFVQTPKGFQRVNVALGATANNRVEVLDGLKPGDRVATQGSYQLRMISAAQ